LKQAEALRLFEERVAHRLDKSNGCWVLATQKYVGYGSIHVRPKTYALHKLVYVAFKGEVPKGLSVLHSCDNKPCCNPRHLFLGTQADNLADMHAKGRHRGWHPVGEMNPAAKLTAKKARQIRAASGLQKDIAVRFGVSKSLVSAIKRGEIWKGD
jgi:hypothetical protein